MTLYIFAVARARTRYFANKHYLILLLSGEPVIKIVDSDHLGSRRGEMMTQSPVWYYYVRNGMS